MNLANPKFALKVKFRKTRKSPFLRYPPVISRAKAQNSPKQSMNPGTENAAESANSSPDGLFSLALLSLLAGGAAGLVGAMFRLSLDQANRWRNILIDRMHADSFVGLVFVIAICAC